MDTKKLRQKVLDLAIRGRLVPQAPNDEPASVLLDRIRAEKARLVGEGKIKKSELTEKPISEEEIPFDVPEGWVWCRFRDISESFIGLTYRPSDVSEKGWVVLRSSNIQNGKIDFGDIVRVNVDIPEKLQVRENDILICARNGSKKLVGKSALITKIAEPLTFGAFMAICRTPFFNYVSKFLLSPLFFEQLGQNSNTTTIYQLTQNNFNNYLIALPPLAEQRRIVSAVDELFEQIDIIERSEKELEEAADKTRSKLLELAIQGHLVPQDPNEEPASALLERIRREKARLVQQGKLKKKDLEEKPISPDEIPFDLPEGWVWCRLGYIVDFSKSKSVKPNQINDNDWVLDLEDIEKETGRLLQKKRMIDIASKSDKHVFKKGNVLYSKLRPYLNKVIIADEDGYCTSEILVFDFGEIYNKYAQYYLMSRFFVDYAMKDAYGVKMPRVGSSQGNMALLPIPPLAEQRRIVTKLEELLHEIDKLKG